MAAKTKIEIEVERENRMAKMEQKLDDVCETVFKIDQKLDLAMNQKADKSEVHEIKGTLRWFAATFITVIIGFIIWLLQGHINFK